MSENVVGLRGQPVIAPGEVVPVVLRMAEDLLEMARAGEIRSLVAAYVYRGEGTGSSMAGPSSIGLLGSIGMIQHRLARQIDEG